MLETFEKGAWKFQDNKYWVNEFHEQGKTVSFSEKKGKKQNDHSFYNSELRIFLTFTKHYDKYREEETIKKHYTLSTHKLSKIFKNDILSGESFLNYFYFENSSNIEPEYQKLFTNFSWLQRRKLAQGYRKLLKKSLIDMSGGSTSEVYLSRNKQLFRESRLSNLLDKK